MTKYQDPHEILRLWETQYPQWQPCEESRRKFLLQPEVCKLLTLEIEIVRQACTKNWKLRDAWSWVQLTVVPLLEGLDDCQRAAVIAPSKNTLVTARAGSGKTRVLTRRVLWLQTVLDVKPNELLLLAFNKKAAEEMEERLRLELSSEAMPHVMTFDALAWALVHPKQHLLRDNAGSSQHELSLAVAVIEKPMSMNQVLNSVVHEDPSTLRSLLKWVLRSFMGKWSDIENGKFDLEKEDAKMLRASAHPTQINSASLNGDRLVAMNGTYLKSEGERLICNEMFLHQVNASYEEPFDWDGTVYRPDFVIRKGDNGGVVIEYFGLLGDAEYRKQAEAKRRYWREKPGWELIEITPKDIASRGKKAFRKYLRGLLDAQGVQWKLLSDKELAERLPEKIGLTGQTSSLVSFITRCRSERMTAAALCQKIQRYKTNDDEESDFLSLTERAYGAYLKNFISNGYEDFNGVMWRAVAAIEGGKTGFKRDAGREVGDVKAIRHVLIDEFQDFSESYLQLVNAIRRASNNVTVYAVGDDWQAINGFAGSDLRYFRNFEKVFPNANFPKLSANYRSASQIVKISNTLMSNSSSVLNSIPVSKVPGRVRLWRVNWIKAPPGENNFVCLMRALIEHHVKAGREVALLSRTHQVEAQNINDFIRTVCSNLDAKDANKVSALTTHKSKGLEYPAVIILDANDYRYPLVHSHWKYQRIFGDTKSKLIAEEKRLLYVALTRGIESLEIVTASPGEESPFLLTLTHHMENGRFEEL
jgi:DNA helicase-4